MKRILLTLPIIAAALISCAGNGQGQQEAPPTYQCAEIDTASTIIFSDFPAEIRGEVVVEIRPRVSGYLDKICITEGSKVHRGEALFIIDQRDLQQQLAGAEASVDAAKAQTANAELEQRKLTPLVEKGIISQFELDNAKSNLVAAKANQQYAVSQMTTARINLSYATITAPVDGLVGRIVVREGTLVSPTASDPLTTVSADQTVSAYFSMDEKSILALAQKIDGVSLKEKIAKLPPVTLLMANSEQYELPGKLELASGQVDMTTGSIQIKANFPNPKGLLRSGSSGVVRLNNPADGVIVVPQKATFETLDQKMVYVVTDSATVTAVAIEIAGRAGNNYVVKTGLEKGQKILLEGLNFVQEGNKITPKYN